MHNMKHNREGLNLYVLKVYIGPLLEPHDLCFGVHLNALLLTKHLIQLYKPQRNEDEVNELKVEHVSRIRLAFKDTNNQRMPYYVSLCLAIKA